MHYQISNIKDIDKTDYRNASKMFGKNIKYKNKDDIELSLAGKALLLKLADKYYNTKSFDIYYNENGKPQTDFCCFSISHSGNYVACAVSDNPIGIDIQIFGEIKKRNRYMLFSDIECSFINMSSDYNLNYLKIWTMKEAYIKAVGGKLSDISNFCLISSSGIVTKYNGFDFTTKRDDNYLFAVCESSLQKYELN